MSLHDWNLANQTPASYRTDHNNLNLAIAGNNASSSGITTTFSHMWYADVSSSGWMRQRNAADSTFNYIYKTDAAGGLCTYGGNPSTNHIGRFVGQEVFDTNSNVYYYCTLAGTSSQATWSMVASSSAYNAVNFPNGYMAGPPPTWTSVTQVTIPSGFKCRDAGNAADISFSSDHVIAITSAGAGGLSTDLTEASSTHYYLFAIRKSGDGTIGGILTTATSAPTLPSGYDQYRMLPISVRNSSAGDFWKFYVGPGWPDRPTIYYQNSPTHFTGSIVAGLMNVLSNGASTTATDVSLASYVPPISRQVILMGITLGASAYYIRQNGSTYQDWFIGHSAASNSGITSHYPPPIKSDTGQVVEYQRLSGSTAAGLYLDVIGYVVDQTTQ